MDEKDIWVLFAAAALAGSNSRECSSCEDVARYSAKDADALLKEYRDRYVDAYARGEKPND